VCASAATDFDKEPKRVAQLGRAAGNIDNGRPILGDPVADSFGGGAINHLGSPRGGIDMTMAAGLIAFAAHVELQRLQRPAPQRQSMLCQLLVETIHVGTDILARLTGFESLCFGAAGLFANYLTHSLHSLGELALAEKGGAAHERVRSGARAFGQRWRG